MIVDIFKIGVYQRKLELNNSYLKNYAYTLKQNSTSNLVSNRGGFQSSNLEGNELDELKKDICHYANIYSKELSYDDVSLTNIWCNINSYKDYNVLHGHSGCVISGVYYTQTPKDCGNIVFYSPAFQVLSHSNQQTPNNHYTSSTWWLPAVEGMLYLFPSWLLHYVESNLNKEEDRISYSFNLNNA